MKNVKVILRYSLPVIILFAVLSISALCQSNMADGFDIDEVSDKVQETSESLVNTIKWIAGVAMSIGAIVVAYMLATNHPQSRNFLIGWIVAAAFIGIAWVLIG